MRDLLFGVVRIINVIGATVLVFLLLLGLFGNWIERSPEQFAFWAAAGFACSTMALLVLVVMLWTRRRADVLHHRGVEIIDGCKGR